MMNYDECIDFLYTKLPMFSRIGPAALKNNLNNTLEICNFLNNPQTKFKTIHVAGTNGKGSVSHMIASIFQSAGFKTGLYTSPHLIDFRERIRINGEMIGKEAVISFTKKITQIINNIEPSFFEVTVGMAFDYFSSENVDIAVIETGLGGRLDSTNVIYPEISIITNIGLDHTHILGNTIEQIAGEKAGIIKHDRPIVIGKATPTTRKIFSDKASETKSEIYFAEDLYQSEAKFISPEIISIQLINNLNKDIKNFEADLPGIYQKENIAIVLTAVEILKQGGWNLNEDAIKEGIRFTKKNTGLLGRWDLISSKPLIIADVAHNIDGINKLLDQIKMSTFESLHLILGLSADKDIDGLLKLLPDSATYYFTQANIPRALNAATLKELANNQNLNGDTYTNVNDAITIALSNATPNDLIIICGSIFVVGEIDRQKFL
jgi:dihydrofolate synthase/folylpolyglutamate synthase